MPIKVTMPALSPTMTEGNLATWLVKEGDTVESGDVIAEIETDKATMEVEAVDEGKIAKILIEAGTENVPVNEVIAVLLEDGEDESAIEEFLSNDNASPAPKAEEPKEEKKEESKSQSSGDKDIIQIGSDKSEQKKADASEPSNTSGDRIFASPLAKRIAADKGLDLANIQGSGPKGRIVKADLENAKPGAAQKSAPSSQTSSSAPQPQGDEQLNEFGMIYTEVPNNNIKKITAKRLLESKTTVPHFYLTVEMQIDNLLASRKQINEAANGEYKLSVNDFIVKACANALKAYPAANVQWTDDAVRQFKHSDISVAVATPNGL
ncbi:MAG: 2-oxo acid dehydrogenase subunit E2, partial [Pseudomonadota bacterium]